MLSGTHQLHAVIKLLMLFLQASRAACPARFLLRPSSCKYGQPAAVALDRMIKKVAAQCRLRRIEAIVCKVRLASMGSGPSSVRRLVRDGDAVNNRCRHIILRQGFVDEAAIQQLNKGRPSIVSTRYRSAATQLPPGKVMDDRHQIPDFVGSLVINRAAAMVSIKLTSALPVATSIKF